VTVLGGLARLRALHQASWVLGRLCLAHRELGVFSRSPRSNTPASAPRAARSRVSSRSPRSGMPASRGEARHAMAVARAVTAQTPWRSSRLGTVLRALSFEHCPSSTVPRALSLEHCPSSTAPRALSLEHVLRALSSTVPRALSLEHCPSSTVPRARGRPRAERRRGGRCVGAKSRGRRARTSPRSCRSARSATARDRLLSAIDAAAKPARL
jgi:hypothetical protein